MPRNLNIVLIAIFIHTFLIASEGNADDRPEALIAGGPEHSVFKQVWMRILDEAGVKYFVKPATAKVRRLWFVSGDIQLDCCSTPEWRQRPAEVASQLYTDTVFHSVQFFIHHKEASIQYASSEDLSLYRVGVIAGHTYRHEQYFGAKVSVVDFKRLFQLIAEGGADIALVNEQEFRFQMGKYEWPIVKGPVFNRPPLKARIRKEHADLLPVINAAIDKLKRTGEIDRMIGEAIRGEM